MHDHNLFLRAKGGAEVALTTDGTAAEGYGQTNWSPDGRHLLAWRVKPGSHLPMYNVESGPAGSRPKLKQYVYDLPGDAVDILAPYVIDAEARRAIKANVEPIDWWSAEDVHWAPDGRHLYYKQVHRGFQRQRVIELDASSGAARVLIDENYPSFVWPPVAYLRYLDETGEMLWTSERDGWNHVYLIDVASGAAKAITHGEWVVREIGEVDTAKRTVVFAAGGREPGQDPYLLH